MPTWKSPLSAASLPSRTRSWRAPSASCVADDRGDLAGDVGRAEARRVGHDVGGGRAADRQRGAQLLDRLGVAEGEHGRRATGRRGDLHGELDGALLVGADGEPDVPAVDGLAVLGEQHLAGGVGHPLDADQDVGHRISAIRSLAGSNSGVASTEPTVTG